MNVSKINRNSRARKLKEVLEDQCVSSIDRQTELLAVSVDLKQKILYFRLREWSGLLQSRPII